MTSGNGRPHSQNSGGWLTTHQRAVAIAVLGVGLTLAVIATALALGVIGSATPVGEASREGASLPPTASELSRSPSPSANSAVPTAEASDPPAASGSSLAGGWIEVASFGTEEGIESVRDVVQAPFGLLAAGVHIDTEAIPGIGPLSQAGRIWLSSDGRTWEDVTPADAFDDASFYELVALSDGAVLVYADVQVLNQDGNPDYRNVVWETADGHTWTEANSAIAASDVVDGEAGYLATVAVELGEPPLRHASDGRHYSEVLPPTNGRIITATAAGEEGFVVLAEVYERADPPTAYASANGVDWYAAASLDWDVWKLAAIGPDWVALGRGFDGIPEPGSESPIWFSSNGLDWARRGGIPIRIVQVDGQPCPEFPSQVISTGSLAVVSSTVGNPCIEGQTLVAGGAQRFGSAYVSADGAIWTPLPFTLETDPTAGGTRGATVSAGVDLDSGTLLVGEMGNRATFWFRPTD